MGRMPDASGVVPRYAAEDRAHDPAVAMAALAACQHGVAARRQLTDLGLTRHEVARMLRRGHLHAVHRGVFAVGHRRLTRDGSRMAAVLASGAGAALSHRTAPRRPGTPNVRRLIEEHRIVPTTTRSRLERRFLTFLDANDLPRPLVNVRTDACEPDFRWTAHRLIIEVDGFETHGTRAAFERDRARDRALMAAGWRVARVTKRQLDDAPGALAAEVRTLLDCAVP